MVHLTSMYNAPGWFVAALGAASLLSVYSLGHAQEEVVDGPQYADGDGLVYPADYRSWPFIGAGLGMSYGEEGGTPRDTENPAFSHVFVNPSSYRILRGTWRLARRNRIYAGVP